MKITVKAALALRNKTIEETAKELGVTIATAFKYIKDCRTMNVGDFVHLCRWLNVEMSDIIIDGNADE